MLLRARVSVLDRPGALLSMAKVIADAGGNIVDIEVLASADGRVVDDLVVDLPDGSRDTLADKLRAWRAGTKQQTRTLHIRFEREGQPLLDLATASDEEILAWFRSQQPKP